MHPRSRHLMVSAMAAFLLSACGTAATPTPAPTATATPTPTATPTRPSPTASSSAGGGHVIHVNLAVPLTTRAPIGSDCGTADLRGTGPKAATIPGARIEFFDFRRVQEMSGEAQPDATINPEQASVGAQTIPDLGVVAAPISDDPNFPAACVFTFDVATSADVGLAYLFSIGSLFADDAVYIPVPAILRSELEAAGWVANIGVNPQ